MNKPERKMLVDLLPPLIEAVEHNWSLIPYESKRGMDLSALIRDFRTIRISIGRRTGQTTAIAKLAKDSDIVVVSSRDVAYMLDDAAVEFPCPIISMLDVGPKRLGSYKTIWVDGASVFGAAYNGPLGNTCGIIETIVDGLIDKHIAWKDKLFPMVVMVG